MTQKTATQLTKRSLQAGLWLTFYRGFSKGAGLIKTIIVARILSPQQFGLFGVVSIGLNLFETFSETGIESALIHQKEIKAVDISTAWVILLVRSFLISLVLFLVAPFIASFFNVPEVVPFIRVISIVPIIRSLRNPQIVFFKRNLDFKKESYMLTTGAAMEVVVGVVATIITQNIWGLVISILAGGLGELIMSYLLISFPKITKPKWSVVKKQLEFGRWVWGSSALSYLVNQGDDMVVGKILGPVALGFYQNAFKLASVPATQITGTITQVTFPAFSSIQDDFPRLKRAFTKGFIFTTLVTLPICLITLIFADPLTRIIYGQEWLPLVPALRILSIFGAVRAISGLMGPLANALGKPKLITMSGVIQAVLLFALIFPFANLWGIVGVSWATVIAIITANSILAIRLYRILTTNPA